MKASVLIYEKFDFVPVVYMLKGLKKSSKPPRELEKQIRTTNLAG